MSNINYIDYIKSHLPIVKLSIERLIKAQYSYGDCASEYYEFFLHKLPQHLCDFYTSLDFHVIVGEGYTQVGYTKSQIKRLKEIQKLCEIEHEFQY